MTLTIPRRAQRVVPMELAGHSPKYVSRVLDMYFMDGLNVADIAGRTGTCVAFVDYVVGKYKERHSVKK